MLNLLSTFNIQSIAAVVAIVVLVIGTLFVIGKGIQLWWAWADRGESTIENFMGLVFNGYSVDARIGTQDPQYIFKHSDAAKYGASVSKQMFYFTKAGANKALEAWSLEDNAFTHDSSGYTSVSGADRKEIVYSIVANKLSATDTSIALSMGVAFLGIVLGVYSLIPTLTVIVGTVFGSLFTTRYLRDLQKAAKRLAASLKAHMSDKEAHTDNASPEAAELAGKHIK